VLNFDIAGDLTPKPPQYLYFALLFISSYSQWTYRLQIWCAGWSWQVSLRTTNCLWERRGHVKWPIL